MAFHSLGARVRFCRAVVLGASALIANCSDYESCEQTRSCTSSGSSAGTGGALGAVGSHPDGSAGTAGSGGNAGTAGDAAMAGTAGTVGRAGTAGDGHDAGDSGDAAGESSDAGPDSPDARPDTTAPTVVSVTPTNGAKGIAKDSNVVIVFSERMDPTKTLAAYSSTDLPAANVNFTWSTDGTRLTIDPKADLTYQANTAPSTAQAKSYAFSIATSAADSAGNTLATAFTSRFSTLRRVVQKLNSNNYAINADPSGTYVEGCSTGIGITVGTYIDYWFGGLTEFDLSVLPADVRLFEKAQLDTVQYYGTYSTGDPFGSDRLGAIVCDHTTYNPPTSGALAGGVVRRMGTLSADANDGPRSLDVVNAVREDYQLRAARRNKTQLRIAFTIQNPDLLHTPSYVTFDCAASALTLTLTYLAP